MIFILENPDFNASFESVGKNSCIGQYADFFKLQEFLQFTYSVNLDYVRNLCKILLWIHAFRAAFMV